MDITTGWVRPPTAITGLDHLAVQAPCITIYSQLLPGITNVTDRARYYSLYPWLIWSFDKRYPRGDAAKFESIFRRADCLLTLVAERHAKATEQDDELHGAAMVGRNTLVAAVAGLGKASDKLSRFATREDVPTRYFKNRLGGLGQYYAGVLQDLAMLAPREREWLRYTHERGEVVAKAVDAEVDGDAFFSLLEKDRFTAADLDDLAEFCPCGLKRSRTEYKHLLDLFFDRNGKYEADGRQRSLSLALILHLVDSLPGDLDIDVEIFRAAVYTGCLPNGRAWRVPPPLAATRDGWRIYQRNELFSIALQGLFTVALDVLDRTEERFETTAAYADWFSRLQVVQEAIKGYATRTLKAAVQRVAGALPELADWENDDHELVLGAEVLSHYWAEEKVDDPVKMYRSAFQLLLSLIARDAVREAAYGGLVFAPGFFEDYPLNLASLRSVAQGDWSGKTGQQVVELLCREWGLDAHLRVALRKLRFDTRATFRVRPTELGLEVVEVPPPVNTNPRFSQAMQMLIDLGALRRRGQSGRLEVTELGRSLLGKSLATEISLVEELRTGGYEASIITTYNAYLPFYEEVVLRRLVAAGCRHNVVLMDHGQCVQALLDSSYKPNAAGTLYTLMPVRVPGAFHPKVMLLAGPKKALALVGSHNLTISGFGYNREITNRIEASKSGDGETIRALAAVWAAIAAWIRSQGKVLPKEVVEAALSVANAAQWIGDEQSAIDTPFLASTPDQPSLWDQLRSRISFKVKRIGVVGPFFDDDFSFVGRLSRDLAPREIVVAVEPDTVALGNPRRLPERTSVVDAKKLANRRGYLHAKAILFESADGNAVLATGSANPGFSAWLAPRMQANAEAVFVRTGPTARVAAAGLGMQELFDYPELTASAMSGIVAEHNERSRVEVVGVPLVIAVEGEEGFKLQFAEELEGVYEAGLLGAGRIDLGKASRLFRRKDELVISVPDAAIRASVRELSLLRKRDSAVFALVHHAEEIAERARTGRQAQFRAALASLSGATPDLARLITLVGDIIFDSEAQVAGNAPRRASGDRGRKESAERPGTLGVSMAEIVRRRAVHRLIRSGDFGYLLDVLIHRLGVGLEARSEEVDHLGRTEEEQRDQDDEAAALADVLSDQEVAATCRRKARTLVSRMSRQLERAAIGETDAPLALVQLLAVLATVRELRVHEQQARWRSAGESLVHEEDRSELLASSLAYLYGRRYALMKKTIADAATDEQPDEVQRLPGLLLWLAWDCGIRLDERKIFGEEPEIARERVAQKAMLLAIAPVTAGNSIAREEAEKSVLKTMRVSQAANARAWLKFHLGWGDQVGSRLAIRQAKRANGKPEPGDLAYIAADADKELYVVAAAAAGYIALVDLSEPEAEVRFLADRVVTLPSAGISRFP